MIVKLVRATVLDGRHREAGEVLDLTSDLARTLLAAKKAVPWSDAGDEPAPATVVQMQAPPRRRTR